MDGISYIRSPESWLTQIEFHGDKRLEAAFELSSELHEGQYRDSGRPYIEHPILVYNILQEFGGSDVQKAVSLLHDTQEDHKGLTPKSLEERLLDKLRQKSGDPAKELPPELQQWAKDVCNGVGQLTNGANLYEGKRTWQVDHVRGLSDELKEVKIADQVASVIDGGILHCNIYDPKKMKKEKGFALKGYDVATNCLGAQADPQSRLSRVHNFYERTFSFFLGNYNAIQAGEYTKADARRHALDIGAMIEDAIAGKRLPKVKRQNVEHVEHIYSPAFMEPPVWNDIIALYPESGIARITLSKTGKVVGMGVIVAENKDDKHPVNTIANGFRAALEDNARAYVTTMDNQPVVNELGLEEYDKPTQVRDFTVKPPIRLTRFLNIAQNAGAIDSNFLAVMLEKAKQMEQSPTRY